MHAGDRRFPSFEPGERLSARGALWTLAGAERGMDCTALRLLPEDAAALRTLLSPFDRFTRIARHPEPAVVRQQHWLQHVTRLSAESHPAGGLRAAAAAHIRLLPYQLEPALAVLRHGAMRLLIADAVGLGKTIQAGLLLAELGRTSAALRALILVPAGLRDQWARELSRLFDLDTIAADASWIQEASVERPADVNPWALPGIYLASLDFVKRPEVLRPLEDVTWDLVVVDEAHACSSRTDRRAAAHAAAIRSTRVLLLTATPHADDPAEFAALCSIGRVHASEPSIVMFRRSRREVSRAPARRSTVIPVKPTPDEERMHHLLEGYTRAVWRESQLRGDELARLAAIVLRKRALSSAASLAASVRRRLALLAGRAEPGREQLRLPLGDEDPLEDDVPAAVLGAPGLGHAPRERRWLAAIAEAAQRASRTESKLRVLRTLLRRIREPAIVFTEYRDTLDRLGTSLAKEGRVLLLLHGGMTPAERSRVQRRFNDGNALLLATDAAAEGLNLHAHCRLVVHHELPWSVTRLEQRAGRVDRLGQERRVHELGLVASSTAERIVLEPLLRRAIRARASGDSEGLSTLLTESRVADAVLGGLSVPPASAAAHAHRLSVKRLDLSREAAAETVRLTGAREALVRVNRRDAVEDRPVRAVASSIASRRPELAPGIILLYVVSLTSRDGAAVHVEPLALHLAHDAPSSRQTSAHALRQLVIRFTNPAHLPIRTHVEAAIRRALDAAAPVHQRVAQALWQRRLAQQRARASAARQLVQAGLFDRRAAAAAATAATVLAPDPEAARSSMSTFVLGVDVRLSAVLRVTAR